MMRLLHLFLIFILSAGCTTSPYVHIHGPKVGDIGYLVRDAVYPDYDLRYYADEQPDRLYYMDNAGLTQRELWRAIWVREDGDYIVFMRWMGASLGVSESLLLDVYDSDFKHVRSGVAKGMTGSAPYALVMARMRTPNIPTDIHDEWRLCVAFVGRIDASKPIWIGHYDSEPGLNKAILELVEWDDEDLDIHFGTGEIGDLEYIDIRSAEPGLEIRDDGLVASRALE